MKTGKTAQNFLNQIQEESSKSAFETLNILAEQLENKTDPEPVEMHLIESIYSFLEHWKRLEGNLKNYVRDMKRPLGNKLASLYEDQEKRKIWR